MEALWGVFFLILTGLLLLLPLLSWLRVATLQRKVQELSDRVARLEYLRATTSAPHPAAAADAEPEGSSPAPPLPVPASVAPDPHVPLAPLAPPAPPPPPPIAPPAPARAIPDAGALEDAIGGVWMQNIGAVVLLLGIFLFILWGYSTGRVGAGVLIGTGVGLGLLAVWRGDRLARSLPRLGHAFIGAGFGAIYLSLYLGHYTLRVLSPPVALVLLTLTSVATFAAGLRYRVQAIAAFGVLGAFIPQLFAAWFELSGFTLTPLALLGYLAIVNVLVFALAARAGWSGLDLAALFLSAVTWLAANPQPEPTWAPIIGLGVLFIGLGLAPLPALVKVEGKVRAVDLAVIAAAPAALMITTWPWLALAPKPTAALFLFACMIPQLLAAWWVDTQRPERDLWRPLTGAAVVFLTLGLQRLVNPYDLAVTWGVEGVFLVLLGLDPRSGWLRACGHVITALAFYAAMVHPGTWGQEDLPASILGANSLRSALLITTFLLGAWALARNRVLLAPVERRAPEAWTFAGNLLLVFWLTIRADEWTGALHRGFTHEAMPAGEAGSWHRWPGLYVAILACTWCGQAVVLAWRGARAGATFLRCLAYVLAGLGVIATLVSHVMANHWRTGAVPVLYPEALVIAVTMLFLLVIVVSLGRYRALLLRFDRRAPEAFAIGLLAISLLWSAREAGHLAVVTSGSPPHSQATRTLAAALTSVAWLLEAVLLLALGWMRTTTLLRWAGLVLLGLTLAKFLIYDLSSADVFWRFLTAIAAGAAMLVVSYFYQRRVKERRN